MRLREAAAADAPAVEAFLACNGLFFPGVLAPGSRWWVFERSDGTIAGSIAMELGETAVLLRSAAVAAELRGAGVGKALLGVVIDAARQAGRGAVFLFSTEAGPYWVRHGFREVPCDDLVAALAGTPQVFEVLRRGTLYSEVAYRLDLDGSTGSDSA